MHFVEYCIVIKMLVINVKIENNTMWKKQVKLCVEHGFTYVQNHRKQIQRNIAKYPGVVE